MICNLCPRNCKIDTNKNCGYCGKYGEMVRVAKVMKHFYEEPIISGEKGSGAIFFSHCNLKCCFCQNFEISHKGLGKDFTVEELANLLKKVEESGVHNINLVTPTHYSDKILEALKLYKPKIPIVWNSSGYEKIETLKKIFKYIDIFLIDFKYFDNTKAKLYSSAPDYLNNVLEILKYIKANKPDVIEDGIMKSGLIIRHLVMPNMHKDSKKIIYEIYNNLGKDVILSLMSQFVPCYKANNFKELNRKVTRLEYKSVTSLVKKLGFENGYLQEFSSASCDYTPNFSDDKFFEL